MIRNLIVDLDGTLFDTRLANVEAYVRAFTDAGSPINAEDYHKHFGLRFDAMVDQIAPHLTEEDRQLVKDRKRHHYQELVTLVKPNQPLIAFLRAMRNSHRTGIATTASRHNAQYLLDYFEVADLFDKSVFGEDVTHGKPNPECYTKCIRLISGSPEETLIFEDSEVGIEAATAAGAQVIRVTL